MSVRDLEKYAYIKPEIRKILDTSAERLQLSPRAYHRVIKLARTIADLENEQDILENHILEALQYRPKVVY
jgi:magnesium chelatase family protein